MYAEGRRLLRMKGAKPHKARTSALSLQPHVLANHVDNVKLAFQLLCKAHLLFAGALCRCTQRLTIQQSVLHAGWHNGGSYGPQGIRSEASLQSKSRTASQ